jgi:hypothetical protein
VLMWMRHCCNVWRVDSVLWFCSCE